MSGYRYTLLGEVWRKLKIGLWVAGVLLALAALSECAQAYQVLSGIHPLLGWICLAIFLGVVAFVILYGGVAMMRRPVVLTPPRCDLSAGTPRDVRRYARYLANVMERLAGNTLLTEDGRNNLRAEAAILKARTSPRQDAAELAAGLSRVVDEVIMPAVAPLDAEAERRVRSCVRDTMVGVAVSPWRSIDLVVVLYRSGRMVLEVSSIYNGRPGFREQLRVMADVLKIAATVQFLNIGSKLMENLTSSIPIVGRFTDDIAQGVGAGLFTSVAGHATIDRCRAFQGWSEEEARNSIGARLKLFMQDLKGIVSDIVVPALKGRIEAQVPEDRRTPNLIDRIKAGISEAIDATSETVDTCVRKPVVVGYKGVASTGAVLWQGTKHAGTEVGRAASWTGRHGWNLASKSAKATGRGISLIGTVGGKAAATTVKKIPGFKRRGPREDDQ